MRYLPLTPDDRTAMLSAIGASSIDDLFVDVPESARLDAPVDLPRVQGELEVELTPQGTLAEKLRAGGAASAAAQASTKRSESQRHACTRKAPDPIAGSQILRSSSSSALFSSQSSGTLPSAGPR